MYFYILENKTRDIVVLTNAIKKPISEACWNGNQFDFTNFNLVSPFKRKHTPF